MTSDLQEPIKLIKRLKLIKPFSSSRVKFKRQAQNH